MYVNDSHIAKSYLNPCVKRLLRPRRAKRVFICNALSYPIRTLGLGGASSLVAELRPRTLMVTVSTSLKRGGRLNCIAVKGNTLCPNTNIRGSLPPMKSVRVANVMGATKVVRRLALRAAQLSAIMALTSIVTYKVLGVLPTRASLSPISLSCTGSLVYL